MVQIPANKPLPSAPPGMLRIPGGDYDFQVRGIEIEGGNHPGVDVQYPWENVGRRTRRPRVRVASLYMDSTPVTNTEYKTFLKATNYHPKDDHNFLRDWKDGSYPAGSDKKPVTWVSIEDARAYAVWAGKRLPHEWEWQYAAQGMDGRLYPWGNDWRAEAVPEPNKARALLPPIPVGTYPQGASTFGVLDLVGNVWQW